MGLARGNNLLAARRFHLHRLIQKSKILGRILCHLCGKEPIVEEHKNGRLIRCGAASRSLNHAMKHLSKPVFRCRHCPKDFSTPMAAKNHVRIKHGVSAVGKIQDRSDEFHTEIMEILSKCFDSSAC